MAEAISTFGKSCVAALIGGSQIGSPVYGAIGTGSVTFTSARSGLITESIRAAMTSVDLSTSQEANYTFDYNSVQMSGLNLSEYGQFAISSGGQLWAGAGFTPISFNGTAELEIQVVWKVI